MRELWLVHPTDLVVTVYAHDGRAFTRPSISETSGTLIAHVLPSVTIDWDRVMAFPPA